MLHEFAWFLECSRLLLAQEFYTYLSFCKDIWSYSREKSVYFLCGLAIKNEWKEGLRTSKIAQKLALFHGSQNRCLFPGFLVAKRVEFPQRFCLFLIKKHRIMRRFWAIFITKNDHTSHTKSCKMWFQIQPKTDISLLNRKTILKTFFSTKYCFKKKYFY